MAAAADDPSLLQRTDTAGRTLLCRGSKSGQLGVVKLLLELGADQHVVDSEGNSALHVGSQEGREEVVKFLLEHGAQQDKPNSHGQTPLMVAAASGRLEVVATLLRHKARIHLKDFGGLTAINLARNRGHTEVVTALLRVVFDTYLSASCPDYGSVHELAETIWAENGDQVSRDVSCSMVAVSLPLISSSPALTCADLI